MAHIRFLLSNYIFPAFKCGFYGQKSAMSQFATFTQFQSLKKLHALHFSIFPLGILNIASLLNLAANYRLRFLNFDLGAILAKFSGKLRHNYTKVEIQKTVIMVTQETIIYRLDVKKSGFVLQLPFSIFWALLGPKKERGPTDTHMVLGPQNPTKNLTYLVGLLGNLLSRNFVSNFSGLGLPPPHLNVILLVPLL